MFKHLPIGYLLLSLFLGGLAWPTWAVHVGGLYDVEVPVGSQSSKELIKGSRIGLRQVFVRVSGDAAVVDEPSIKAAITRANTFTKQFRYENRHDPVDNSEQLILVVNFEQALVEQTLRQSGLSLWSSNRPSALIWMVVEDSNGRRFVGNEQDPTIIEAVARHALRRGLAIKLPALDLEDMVAISVDEMWQLNNFKLHAAASRYQADSVLFGRASQLTNGNWLGRGRFDFNGQHYDFDYEAANIDDYVAAVVDQIAQQMATEYAVSSVNSSGDDLLMRLSNVDNFVDYARVVSYLESIAAVRHVNVVSIEGREIIVRLVADGLITQLQQAIALDKQLQEISNVRNESGYLIDLEYRWLTHKP